MESIEEKSCQCNHSEAGKLASMATQHQPAANTVIALIILDLDPEGLGAVAAAADALDRMQRAMF